MKHVVYAGEFFTVLFFRTLKTKLNLSNGFAEKRENGGIAVNHDIVHHNPDFRFINFKANSVLQPFFKGQLYTVASIMEQSLILESNLR